MAQVTRRLITHLRLSRGREYDLGVAFERLRRRALSQCQGEEWAEWLLELWPDRFIRRNKWHRFAHYHRDFWEHIWRIASDIAPDPLLSIWPRGTGKSTCAEIAAVRLGAEDLRRYCLYVSATQDMANQHVGNISALLESPTAMERYPRLCERQVSQYGVAKGWRVNRLWTASGYVIDAAGLDKAVRGSRIEEQRPDVIVFDDVDQLGDSPRTVEKNVQTITRSILPAADHERVAILFAQNVIQQDSVLAQLVKEPPRFLSNRILSGPFRAIEDLEYEQQGNRIAIVGGKPTWRGMGLADCERIIEREGLPAFLAERQQIFEARRGALWTQDLLDSRRAERPEMLTRIIIGVDPAGTQDPDNSEVGIVICGRDRNGWGYVLHDASGHFSVPEWGLLVAQLYEDWDADAVVAETNYGAGMVHDVLLTRNPNMKIAPVHSKRGKVLRAEPVANQYVLGRAWHAGHFQKLETQLTTPYAPDHPTETFDRMDAVVHALTYLLLRDEILPNLDPYQHRAVKPTQARKAVVPHG